ncbi:MAG TPA: hypothetical protein VFX76_10185, partial [Roseiflexaceae bacterium]|nr:hypothetical protein [Roseiflexaceae bacterium]
MRKIVIGVVVLALLGAAIYAAFLRGAPADTETETSSTAPVLAADTLVAEAKVVPVRSAALSLPIGGVIAEVLV